MICSNLLVFESLKPSTAGDGVEVKILMMPLGKDRVMSPVIFTMHLKSHLRIFKNHFTDITLRAEHTSPEQLVFTNKLL